MSVDEQVKLSNFSSIFSLEGKVAVVTGGSRGLGLHAASGYISLALCQLFLHYLFLTSLQSPASRLL